MSLAPTSKLRWVMRTEAEAPPDADGMRWVPTPQRVLQQWWAADVPSYMRGTEGEWRDVDTVDT